MTYWFVCLIKDHNCKSCNHRARGGDPFQWLWYERGFNYSDRKADRGEAQSRNAKKPLHENEETWVGPSQFFSPISAAWALELCIERPLLDPRCSRVDV